MEVVLSAACIEQMLKEGDRRRFVSQRKYDWIDRQTDHTYDVAAISRGEMRSLVHMALDNGITNNGGCYPSGTTVSYYGEAQFEWGGHKWTATGTRSKGKFSFELVTFGTDGCITFTSDAGHLYRVTDIPENVTGWWEYLVEGPEGLINEN